VYSSTWFSDNEVRQGRFKEIKMKNLFKISTLALMFLSVTSIVTLPSLSSQASLREPSASVLQDKKCEKCKRGDDGKMVCEPVPCP
jgi:hypothetical protein